MHEQLVVDGVTVPLGSDLLHYTDPDLDHYFVKFNRYTSLAAEDMAQAGRRPESPACSSAPRFSSSRCTSCGRDFWMACRDSFSRLFRLRMSS